MRELELEHELATKMKQLKVKPAELGQVSELKTELAKSFLAMVAGSPSVASALEALIASFLSLTAPQVWLLLPRHSMRFKRQGTGE